METTVRLIGKLVAVCATVVLVPLGCSTSDHIRLTLSGDGSELTSDSAVSITLYGYNTNLADAPATAITSQKQTVASLPVTVTLNVPPNPHTLITGEPAADEAKYFIDVMIDDGNGDSDLPCGVQYTQDFERSGWQAFTLGDISSLDIWLKAC